MSALTITLNDGHQIPWLGFGTGGALIKTDAESAVRTALALGIRHFDTAQLYNNEETLGAAIAGMAGTCPRETLFVTTKLAKVPEGATVRGMVLASLEKLRMEYVDLLLIHQPLFHPGKLGAVWREFEALQREGFARSIGVSNFGIADFEELLKDASVIPAVNEIEYHPYVYKANEDLIEFHKKHNIITTSYGGLAPIVHHKGGPVDAVLAAVRARLETDTGKSVTEGQVLGLWLKALGIVQITTSSKEERVKEYVATQALPPLAAEEVAAITEAGSQVHFQKYSVATSKAFQEALASDK